MIKLYKSSIYIVLFSFFLFLAACSGSSESEQEGQAEDSLAKDSTETIADNELTEAEKSEGWILLFDGKSTDGWRNYNADTLGGWIVEERTLKSLGKGGDIGGDIVYGKEEFGDFELYLDWKISEGGNSGIFYHVQEGKEYKAPYENAPEYQLIDDEGFPDPLEDWQELGADYAMYPADSTKKIVKKPGEWNSSRIRFEKKKVTYWLNGEEVVSFEVGSEDWNKRKAEGKWKDFPKYGTFEKGLIGLQDHGSFIWFKNIKIKKL